MYARLSARGAEVTAGHSATLCGLLVGAAGTDGLGVLELACAKDDLDCDPIRARRDC